MDPTLQVLLFASGSAALAALGPLPLVGRDAAPTVALGWANASAAGLMLGAAYLLMSAGLAFNPLAGAGGAALGIGLVWAAHVASGTDELDLNKLGERSEVYGYKVILVNTLHSAWEGVAIGAAFAVSLQFGSFMAITLAIHNVPESTVLAAVLRSRGLGSLPAAALGVATAAPQPLCAVAVFAIGSAAPGFVPWGIGFAVGSLIYLVMSELLPECYHQAGRTTIALVTLLAMGIAVLLGGTVG